MPCAQPFSYQQPLTDVILCSVHRPLSPLGKTTHAVNRPILDIARDPATLARSTCSALTALQCGFLKRNTVNDNGPCEWARSPDICPYPLIAIRMTYCSMSYESQLGNALLYRVLSCMAGKLEHVYPGYRKIPDAGQAEKCVDPPIPRPSTL
jgi:hypothetical protein